MFEAASSVQPLSGAMEVKKMNKSESISKIVPALLAAQRLMGAAKKGSTNPYFKSKYADLGSVLEACKDLLNENGITILQPHSADEFGAYVETLLVHESGEYVGSKTKIQVAKANDPQALGSAITYARRYGLQSLLSMPAEDDDGESAMDRRSLRLNEESESGKEDNGGDKKKVSRNVRNTKVSSGSKTTPVEKKIRSESKGKEAKRETINEMITKNAKVIDARGVMSMDDIKAYMKSTYNVEKKEELTDEQAREFYSYLDSRLGSNDAA